MNLGMNRELSTGLAREGLYRFLGAALSDPRQARFHVAMSTETRDLLGQAIEALREDNQNGEYPPGFGELPASDLDVDPVFIELDRERPDLVDEYDRVFGLTFSRECPPYETEYDENSEPFFRAQQLADIAGFYRAFGVEPSRSNPEHPDHLALELEFMAFVLMKKRLAEPSSPEAGICAEIARAFFRDHLAWWVPLFATGLRKKAGQGFYEAVARCLSAFMPLERARYDVPPPRHPRQALPTMSHEEPAECTACET